MISKFSREGHLSLIVIRRMFPPAELFEFSKGKVIFQANALPQFIQNQHCIWWASFS